MYHIEVEQDDKGDMAVRVFKYTVGGAILHGMTATDGEINVMFPQPCVIFLRNNENTPANLKWNIKFFDGQEVTLQIPTIRLSEMSVEEIARRNLLPVGQFYMRTFEPLDKRKVEKFREAASSLLAALKEAVNRSSRPFSYHRKGKQTGRLIFNFL